MKREELKAETIVPQGSAITLQMYGKAEADSVMDAMENRIKELEQRLIHKGCIEYVEQAILNGDERLNNRMAFLLGFTPYEMSVKKFKEEHKLEREQKEARIKELENKLEIAIDNAVKYCSIIKELEETQPKWISVEDRLPDECESVLLYNNEDNGYNVGWIEEFKDKMWEWCDWNFNYPSDSFTHWMPLPQPPKSED